MHEYRAAVYQQSLGEPIPTVLPEDGPLDWDATDAAAVDEAERLAQEAAIDFDDVPPPKPQGETTQHLLVFGDITVDADGTVVESSVRPADNWETAFRGKIGEANDSISGDE